MTRLHITWLCLLLSACSDDEAKPPSTTQDVQMSGCKNQPDAGAINKADVDAGARECVSWRKLDQHTLRFALTDLGANCSVDWQVSAKDEGSTLELVLHNQECTLTRCSCRFDLGVTVPDLELGKSLALRVTEQNCDGTATDGQREATLAIGEASEGMVCFE